MERIEGIPSPPRGLVFGEFRPDIHVQPVEYVKDTKVSLWIDPGYAGAYAVVVIQEINGQVCVIDEIYEQGLITSEIVELAQSRPWWPDVKDGVIDVAGHQHQAMAAPAEVWLQLTGLYLNSQKVKINDQTRAYRCKTDRDGSILNDTPEDKYNHSIKAMIYGLIDRYGYGYVQNREKIRVRRW